MKKLQLMISNPCSENWDEMTPTEKGRYCESCEKNIVDLTQKSDAELIAFFTKKKANVCGRLHPHQLNREMITPPQKRNWPWLLPLAIGSLAISPAYSTTPKTLIERSDLSLTPERRSHETQAMSTDTVAGRVLNEHTGEALSGVKVRQKGFENVLAITDNEGKFKVNVAQINGTETLTFEKPGYRHTEVVAFNTMVVKLLSETRVILGRIARVDVKSEPLHVLYAGKKSCIIDATTLKGLNPEWIEDVNLLGPAQASALYGSKAANGAIVIQIKKAHAKNFKFSKDQK